MKSTIIDILNNILPSNYFVFFNKIEELLVIKEMGPHKFVIYFFLVLAFSSYLVFSNNKLILRRNFLNFFSKKEINILILILFVSSFFVYFSYVEYAENPNIFYSSTTSEKNYGFLVYFLFFSFTNLIFYIFSKELTSSGKIAIIATMFWIASSIHIANLYPSLLRDYFKAAIFLVNFICIMFIFYSQIGLQNVNTNLHICFIILIKL